MAEVTLSGRISASGQELPDAANTIAAIHRAADLISRHVRQAMMSVGKRGRPSPCERKPDATLRCFPRGTSSMAAHLRLSSLAPSGLIVESIAESEDAVVVSARARTGVRACPLCGTQSEPCPEPFRTCRVRAEGLGFGSQPDASSAKSRPAEDGFSLNARVSACRSSTRALLGRR